MSDNYLILEEVKYNTSYLDGSTYKTYITNFFSYTKARHKIQYLYDENDNVHSIELYEIIYVFLTIFLYLLKCPQSLIL